MAITASLRPEFDDEVAEDGTGNVTVKQSYVFSGTNSYSALRTYVLLGTPVGFVWNGFTLWRKSWTPHFQPGSWGTFEVEYTSSIREGQAIQPEGTIPPAPNTPTDGDKLGVNWTVSTRGGTVNQRLAKETMYGVRSLSATPGSWAVDTAYKVGQQRVNGGKVYVVTEAGTSDSSGGPTGTGTDIVDNQVVWNYVSDATGCPNNQNIIGLSKDGAKGVDRPAMKQVLSIEVPIDVNLPLLRTTLRVDDPRTNSQSWLGWDAGELLFVGMEARGNETGRGTMTIHMEGGENLYNGDPRLVIVPGLVTLANPDSSKPAKRAHEYVDVYYTETITADMLYSAPKYAYVLRLYDSMSFSDVFGFG